ncbi:hypothetical protein [Gloeocapsopsis dulcis]|uniref:Uncharacterized protein n=1 Tax=Gloeocapsopsis dulcis AAB1 = 1H9 TaxID=1433147 RepID=A0A6N8FTR8_9CHRO|nr:hypothetical protein [Gloeocapsopsis dulcis]MUL36508.1 hypothetical protein [Gloeocapsopsis dulcis AAB1 = 1H9]WNN87793.1 hypothetical protein P0S91_15915 [Gloeocapsopsis dulcis]
MINKLSSLCSLLRQVPLASLLLGMGIFASEVMPGLMPSAIAASPYRNTINSGKDTFPVLRGKLPQQDGVYLYGRAPQPQQIGQEYMVFELHQGKVIGAFYLPYSEFSCFSGNINSGELALIVADAPDAGEDALAQPQQIATASDPRLEEEFSAISYPYAVALQEYYQLPEVSTSDRQILQTCRNNYSN